MNNGKCEKLHKRIRYHPLQLLSLKGIIGVRKWKRIERKHKVQSIKISIKTNNSCKITTHQYSHFQQSSHPPSKIHFLLDGDRWGSSKVEPDHLQLQNPCRCIPFERLGRWTHASPLHIHALWGRIHGCWGLPWGWQTSGAVASWWRAQRYWLICGTGCALSLFIYFFFGGGLKISEDFLQPVKLFLHLGLIWVLKKLRKKVGTVLKDIPWWQ